MAKNDDGSSADAHGRAGETETQAAAWASVKLLVLDVDGVLTDGKTYQDNQGRLRRSFSVRDAISLRRWRKCGGKVAVLTALKSDNVREEVEKIGVDFFIEACDDKSVALSWIFKSEGIGFGEVAIFAAADADLDLAGRACLCIAARTAAPTIRDGADVITKLEPGDGAVAEACATLLKSRPAFEPKRRRLGVSGV